MCRYGDCEEVLRPYVWVPLCQDCRRRVSVWMLAAVGLLELLRRWV